MDKERIYQDQEGQWFFRLRGEESAGPFVNYDEAQWALHKFIVRKNDLFDAPLKSALAPALRKLARRAPRILMPLYRQSA